MMQKLRNAMKNEMTNIFLVVKLSWMKDFFTVEVSDEQKCEPLKRGRGSRRKCKMLVIAESE